MRWTLGGRLQHPRVRTSSERFFPLDELVSGSASNITQDVEVLTENQGAPFTTPAVVPGPVGGRSLRFNGSSDRLGGGADAGTRTALLGEWTFGVVFRAFDISVGQRIAAYQGTNAEDEANNALMTVSFAADGVVGGGWEEGAAGSDETGLLNNFKIVPGQWYYLVMRKSLNGAGPNFDLDWFVGGELVETGSQTTSPKYNAAFNDMLPPTGGTSAEWHLGCGITSGGGISAPMNGEIGGVYLWDEVLTTQQILDDSRRMRCMDRFMYTDLRVDIEDPDGNMVDYTCAEGLDWVDNISTSNAIDNAAETMTVKLLREQGGLSLATLKTDSKFNQDDLLGDPADPANYVPAVDANRTIDVYTARVPLGTTANRDEMEHQFAGRIDDVEWGGSETVSLTCRDQGGILIDTIIRADQAYGDPVLLTPVQTEMQRILYDNDNATAQEGFDTTPAIPYRYDPVQLYVPVDPTWDVNAWEQRKEPVMSALRTLAQQIGWECRYRYSQQLGFEGHRLTFFRPERDRVEPDLVLTPDDILSYSEVKLSTKNVRNGVIIAYASAETIAPDPNAALTALALEEEIDLGTLVVIDNCWVNIDNFGNRVVGCVHLQDNTSAAKWGLRESVIVNAGTEQIDTVVEAVKMAVGYLKDLREPLLEVNVAIPLHPEIELGDMLYVAPHKELFTGRQLLAVKSVSHTYGARAQTTLTLRGKPSIGFKRWLSLESRPGLGPPTIIDPQQTLTDVTSPGQIRPVNHQNSNQDRAGDYFLRVANNAFQAYTNGKENGPDNWRVAAGTFGTVYGSNDMVYTTTSLSGTSGVTFKKGVASGGGAGTLESDPFPVDGRDIVPYSLQVSWQRTFSALASDSGVQVVVDWYNADKTTSAGASETIQFRGPSTANGAWFTSRRDGFKPPSSGTARWARLSISQLGETLGGIQPDLDVIVDAVAMYYKGREAKMRTQITNTGGDPPPGGYPPADYIDTVDQWYALPLNTAAHTLYDSWDYGKNVPANAVPGNGPHFLVQEDGVYDITVQTGLIGNGAGSYEFRTRIKKNDTYDTSSGGWVPDELGTSSVEFVGGRAFNGGPGLPAPNGIQQESTRLVLQEGDRIVAEVIVNALPAFGSIDPFEDQCFMHVKLTKAD